MPKHLTVSISQFTHPGPKEVNQDFHGVLIPDEPALSTKGVAVAIADGISSSNVSHIASQTAINSFFQDYYSTSDSWSVKKSAQLVLKAINSWLYAQTQNSSFRFEKDKGYICTFSALVFKSQMAHLFHSGDSRVFQLVGSTLEQLTTDHRRIVSEDTSYLTRALGIHDYAELDYRQLPINEGDVFVLATDGVYEYLSENDIVEAIAQTADFESIAEPLVHKAFAAGSQDNLTLQIIKINQLAEPKLNEVHQQLDRLPAAPQLQARTKFDGFTILREIYMSSRSHVLLAQDDDSLETVVITPPPPPN